MLLRVISRQFRTCILHGRVNYHLAAKKSLLYRSPEVLTLQSSRTLKKNAAKVKTETIDSKTVKTANYEQENDPDIFGTFSETKPFTENQETTVEDEGDVAESDYTTNIPFRSQKLSTKKYADMIKEHFKYKRLKEAIDVVEVRMLKEDQVKPENYIYNLLIGECGRLGYTKKAFEMYTRMKQRGLKITGGTYTALFNACANSPFLGSSVEKANNLRKIMLQTGYVPNENNYNAMIKAYGRCNQIETAFQLVDEMKGHNLQLKVDTFNFLLQACISDKEYGFRHALLVWHKIHNRRLTPDLFTFNLMLKCVAECGIGDLETMRGVIAQILSQNKRAAVDKNLKVRGGDKQMLEIIPKQKAGKVTDEEGSDADDVLTTTTDTQNGDEENSVVAPEANSSGEAPNLLSKTPHLGSLVALKTVKMPEDRLLLLGGISGFINEMEEANVRPDIKTFTKMLDIIPSTRAAEEKLIGIVRKANVSVDVDFFNMLMKKRSMRYDYNGAKEVLHLIEVAKLEPDIVTFGLLALGCKVMEDAKEYLQDLHFEGIKINIEILGAMLKNACYLKDYDYVLEVLHACQTNKLKPSPKFIDIVYTFNKITFQTIRNPKMTTKHDKNEVFRFSREFKKWQKDMNLDGLDKEAAIKATTEHPWKQFKEAQPDGEETTKNLKKRLSSKKKHSIRKLTKTRVEKCGQPTPPLLPHSNEIKENKTVGAKPRSNGRNQEINEDKSE